MRKTSLCIRTGHRTLPWLDRVQFGHLMGCPRKCYQARIPVFWLACGMSGFNSNHEQYTPGIEVHTAAECIHNQEKVQNAKA